MEERYPKTFFIDIDGTLLYHLNAFSDIVHTDNIPPLPDAVEKVSKWHCEGHTIIITTARPESLRGRTAKQLDNAGIVYDQLVMGLTSGVRILINDYVPDTLCKAKARNVRRNVDGLSNID
jgi:hypothetical protein